MPIKHAIWTVGKGPKPLSVTKLETEQLLEDMIESDPRILSEPTAIFDHKPSVASF